MTENNSVKQENFNQQLINTINLPSIYPAFEMLTKNRKGNHRFEVICAIKISIHAAVCIALMQIIHVYTDLSRNNYINFYFIGFFMTTYLLGQVLFILKNREKIIVKHIFKKIESLGGKGTLFYFLATLRKSSFVTNKEYFNEIITTTNYSKIAEILLKIFEIVDKENQLYHPIILTPEVNNN